MDEVAGHGYDQVADAYAALESGETWPRGTWPERSLARPSAAGAVGRSRLRPDTKPEPPGVPLWFPLTVSVPSPDAPMGDATVPRL
jgi:hypothetical protein